MTPAKKAATPRAATARKAARPQPLPEELPEREPISVKPERTKGDRRLSVLLVLSGIVSVLVILGTPVVISTANGTAEVRKGNDLAACRSEYGSLVTEARSALDEAKTNLDLATNIGLTAAVTGDDATVVASVAQLPALRTVVSAAVGRLQAATAVYRDALALARTDPAGLLAQCRASGAPDLADLPTSTSAPTTAPP